MEEQSPSTFIALTEEELPSCVAKLHENHFLMKSSAFLINPIAPLLQEHVCHAITGLLLGSALRDKALIR
jgi:hypothetical protein